MKKVIVIFIFLISYTSLGQKDDSICLTDYQNRNTMSGGADVYRCTLSSNFIRNKLHNFGNDFSNESPLVINVKFHFDHSFANQFTMCDLLGAVDDMNRMYNQFRIYFKYIGYDYQTDFNIIHQEANYFHIVVSTYGSIFIGDSFSKIIQVGIDCILPHFPDHNVLNHETGHAIGLRHTYMGSTAQNGIESVAVTVAQPYDCFGNLIENVRKPDFTNYHPTSLSDTEHVTRDSSNPNYNALTAGDCVPDTDAEVINLHFQKCINPNTNDFEIISFPEVVDIVGEPYDLDYLSSHNLMGAIQQQFLTPGQGWRARSYILDAITYNQWIGTAVNPDAIKVFYEPYYVNVEVDMDNNHIISAVDDPNNPGYMIVCRPTMLVHKFQKGFTYMFYNVGSVQYHNGDVVNPNDAILLNTIAPGNTDCIPTINGGRLAVKIPELADDIIMFDDTAGVRGSICQSEQIITTNILSKDDPASPIGNERILDVQESANPNLIENLENNKYHFIHKTTEKGVINDKIIYKSN